MKKTKILQPLLYFILIIITVNFASKHDKHSVIEKKNSPLKTNRTALKDKSTQLDESILNLFSKKLENNQLFSNHIQHTDLKISLVGIMQSNNPEQTTALLSYKEKTLPYTTSGAIGKDKNITVHKIEASSIIIANNNKFEIIKLFNDDKNISQDNPQQHTKKENNHISENKGIGQLIRKFKTMRSYQ